MTEYDRPRADRRSAQKSPECKAVLALARGLRRPVCSAPDCGRPLLAKGLCGRHYQEGKRMPRPCVECGAPLPKRAKFYCGDACLAANGSSERRRRRLLMGSIPKSKDGRYVNPAGYVSVRASAEEIALSGRVGRCHTLEHRLVMALYLGRPLAAHENVHHINGQRADNRLENLELWSKSQPAGQRVADKIAWAIDFLHEYGIETTGQLPLGLAA